MLNQSWIWIVECELYVFSRDIGIMENDHLICGLFTTLECAEQCIESLKRRVNERTDIYEAHFNINVFELNKNILF